MIHTETPSDGESSTSSLRTLALVAAGGILAVGAAYFVRPSPKLENQASIVVPVVPAAVLAVAPAKPDAVPPKPAASPPPAPAQPALSPERQRLAQMMSEAAGEPAPATRAIQPPQPSAAPARAIPQVSAFAPEPERPGAMQALAALAPPRAPAGADEAEKKRMAEQAAKAIRDGDIATARSILEKSLAAGDEAAAMALAETYDPVVLAAMKLEDVTADPKRARSLYEKASTAGFADAHKRLAALKRYERHH